MAHALRVTSLAIVAWAISFTGISPAIASHTTFSSSVDRFEADGNAYGTADGVADLVDEFDDGTLAPNFAPLLGTSVESGGVLTLRDPGTDISLVPGVALDISTVESTVELEDGLGDFTITSSWQALPALNSGFHFQIYGAGTTIESAGMTVNNLDASNSPPGSPVGYTVAQEVFFTGGGGGTPQQDVVAINAGDVTGQIVLRMTFDDATNTVTSSFSLNGGLTFQSPFPPLPVFQVVPDGEILLGANSIRSLGGPPPACAGTIVGARGSLDLSRGAGAHRLTLRGTLSLPPSFPVTFNPVAEGAQIVIDFLGAGNVLNVDMPPGAVGTGCEPRDGWRSNRTSSYGYSNRSYYQAPACSTLAAGHVTTKLRTSKLARDRTLPFSLMLREANIGPSATEIHAVVHLDDTCAEVTVSCATTGRVRRCQ